MRYNIKQRCKDKLIGRIMHYLPFTEDSDKYRMLVEHYNKLSEEDLFFLDKIVSIWVEEETRCKRGVK